MAMTAGEIIWKINGDTSGFDKSIQQAEKNAKGLGKTWSGVGKKITAALVGIGLGALVKRFIKAGSDAEEVAQKFGVVFKGVTKEANEMARNLAVNYGMSRTEAKKLLADTGDLLTGFGFTKKEALSLSNRVQKLSVDLASFSNVQGGAKFASEALTKGLFGETEQMKSLGIVVNQNSKEFKDLVQKYQQTEGMTLNQAKANAILEMAVSQSGNAIGDFNRSMDSFANQSRIAEANIANIEETIGTKLIPIAGLAMKVFNEFAVELDNAAQELGNFISSAEGAEKVGDVIGTIAGAFSAAWVIMRPIFVALKESFDLIIEAFEDFEGPIVDGAGAMTFFSTVSEVVAKSLKLVVVLILAAVKNILNLVDVIMESGRTIGSFFKALAGKGSWEAFDQNAEKAKNSMVKFGANVKQGYIDVGNAIVDLGDAFGAGADETAQKAMKAYTDTHKTFKDATKNALLAQQEKNEVDEQANEQNKKNTKSLGERTAALETFTESLSQVSSAASSGFGQVEGLFSSISDLSSAIAENRIADLDAQMERELEAAGLLEETKEQQLMNEIERAQMAGDSETAEEKKKQLQKQKIEEKYSKKRAMIEYQVALMQWKFKLAFAIASVPLAIMQGLIAGLQIPVIGVVMGPIYAALAGATAALQVAAVAASKPKPPSFQMGGIVAGTQPAGDNVAAQVNSGELILNGAQQRRLFDIADGRQQGGGAGNLTIYIGDEMIYNNIYEATKNGELFIDERALVTV